MITITQNHSCDCDTCDFGIDSNLGKLRAWSRAGGPAAPGLADLGDDVWTADKPAAENGLRILGTPIGRAEFVEQHAQKRPEEEHRLLRKLPELPDLQ